MPISELAPFNPHRFKVCMAYMAKKFDHDLSRFDYAKLHVLTDYFHVVACGRPVIGGKLRQHKLGPVVSDTMEEVLKWEPAHKIAHRYQAPPITGMDDISPMEFEAMDKAVDKIKQLATWENKKRYFHSESNPLGYAWKKAHHSGSVVIDWRDVLEAHEKQSGRKLAFVRALIEL